MKEFANITPSKLEKKLSDVFSLYFGDVDQIYVTHETYHLEDNGVDDKGLDYQFILAVEDMSEYDVDSENYLISLYLVPCASSVAKKKLDDVCNCQCVDEEECCAFDFYQYGLSLCLGSVEVPHQDTPVDDNAEVQEYLQVIANIVDTINSLIGFYLDRVWNGIGSDGWDVIQSFVTGEQFPQITFKRQQREREEA